MEVDVLGVGLGPFNLGLAALLAGADTGLSTVFLDQQEDYSWHAGMLIPGTTLEVPFLADLVTLADPTNRYSYLNYLREKGRLYRFYFHETFQTPRREYSDYLSWVADELSTTRFGRRVTEVREFRVFEESRDGFLVEAVDTSTGDSSFYLAENLVLGVGTKPYVPDCFSGFVGGPGSSENGAGESGSGPVGRNLSATNGDSDGSMFHTSRYLDNREVLLDELGDGGTVTVVGSGQSAAEVVLDLLESRDGTEEFRLDWVTRSEGFFPMEYSKLGLQHFTPDYVDYFYGLREGKKDDVRTDQDLLYKGIDVGTSEEIYDELYRQSIGDDDPGFGMVAHTEIVDVEAGGNGYRLYCRHQENGDEFGFETDAVVLGTGYHRPDPEFLEPIESKIRRDSDGRYVVSRDYRVETDLEGGIFVQNADIHSHGVGSPDLGLGCYRNTVIINELTGRETYRVDRDTVFQDFDVESFLEGRK
ncbi:MAG: lysine N(6)-hydroxylase/L-ornithine N(5)-oxygenase family protein [Halobacteria archaeon]